MSIRDIEREKTDADFRRERVAREISAALCGRKKIVLEAGSGKRNYKVVVPRLSMAEAMRVIEVIKAVLGEDYH